MVTCVWLAPPKRRGIVLASLVYGLGLACAGPGTTTVPSPALASSSGPRLPEATPTLDHPVDAGVTTTVLADAQAEPAGPRAGQVDAATSEFPAYASCAGLVEGQCCAPSPRVSLCVRAISANHVTGKYTSRIVVVNTTNEGATIGTMLPLVTRSHGSMKVPDPIVERLDVRVGASEIELVAVQGCRPAAKPRTTVCAAEGHYGLRDGAFRRLDPEE